MGYPDILYRWLRHPVVWIGAAITGMDRAWNRAAARPALRRGGGVLTVLVLVAGGAGTGLGLDRGIATMLVEWPWWALGVKAVLASSLLAQRSLHDFVARVPAAMDREGLAGGRRAVAHIVGRDPESLDAAAVNRAAIESLAENFSDGVVAPAFWLLVGGLPGLLVYKAVNTADSMIGHKNERYLQFGWAAARLDDLLNLPASRLTAALIALAALTRRGAKATGALRAVFRDASRHRSPNAGWPEAAMAGALDLRLAGPRRYGGAVVDDAWMGDGRATATTDDARAALSLYRRSLAFMWLAAALLTPLF